MYLWEKDLVLPLKPGYVLFFTAQVNSSRLLILWQFSSWMDIEFYQNLCLY